MFDHLKLGCASLLFVLLAGCNGSNDRDEGAATGINITGIAASGAALDNATVTLRGPDGQLIDLGDVITGGDGSYQVDLPPDTPLPLLVIVRPPEGAPLRTVIPAIADGAASIVANINPVTELVTNELAGAPSEDPAAVATSLVSIANDPTLVASTGNDVVEAIFGNDIDYGAFADDPDFTAAGGTDLPTVADTLLDTLADVAADEGKPLGTFLAEQRALPEAPRLLTEPAFQVKLVGQLVAKGHPSDAIESALDASGALPPFEGDQSTDLFRAVIEAVPQVMAQADAATVVLDDSPGLKVAAARVAVDALAKLVSERSTRFGDSPASLAAALASPGLRSAVATVVTNVITPILQQVAARGDEGSGVANALDGVLRATARAAGTTLSAFALQQIDATDITVLATAHLQANVIDSNLADQLDAIEDGLATTADLVQEDSDVSQTTEALRDLLANDPGLLSGADTDVVLDEPPGAWNLGKWNEFDWS